MGIPVFTFISQLPMPMRTRRQIKRQQLHTFTCSFARSSYAVITLCWASSSSAASIVFVMPSFPAALYSAANLSTSDFRNLSSAEQAMASQRLRETMVIYARIRALLLHYRTTARRDLLRSPILYPPRAPEHGLPCMSCSTSDLNVMRGSTGVGRHTFVSSSEGSNASAT